MLYNYYDNDCNIISEKITYNIYNVFLLRLKRFAAQHTTTLFRQNIFSKLKFVVYVIVSDMIIQTFD